MMTRTAAAICIRTRTTTRTQATTLMIRRPLTGRRASAGMARATGRGHSNRFKRLAATTRTMPVVSTTWA